MVWLKLRNQTAREANVAIGCAQLPPLVASKRSSIPPLSGFPKRSLSTFLVGVLPSPVTRTGNIFRPQMLGSSAVVESFLFGVIAIPVDDTFSDAVAISQVVRTKIFGCACLAPCSCFGEVRERFCFKTGSAGTRGCIPVLPRVVPANKPTRPTTVIGCLQRSTTTAGAQNNRLHDGGDYTSFKMAGWRRCGRNKDGRLTILERRPEWKEQAA